MKIGWFPVPFRKLSFNGSPFIKREFNYFNNNLWFVHPVLCIIYVKYKTASTTRRFVYVLCRNSASCVDPVVMRNYDNSSLVFLCVYSRLMSTKWVETCSAVFRQYIHLRTPCTDYLPFYFNLLLRYCVSLFNFCRSLRQYVKLFFLDLSIVYIIKPQHYKSCILILSSGKKGEEDKNLPGRFGPRLAQWGGPADRLSVLFPSFYLKTEE